MTEYTDDEIKAAMLLIWERPGVADVNLMWHLVENEYAYSMARTLLDALAEVRDTRLVPISILPPTVIPGGQAVGQP